MTEAIPNRRRIDQFRDMWEEDSQPFQTDPDKLPGEAARLFSVMAKYMNLKSQEVVKLAKKNAAADKLRFRLTRLYRDGPLSKEEQETVLEQGWELPPEGKCAVKTDVKQWVETNPAMVELMIDVVEQNEIVELLDRAYWALKERSEAVRQTMQQVRFIHGG